MILGNIHTNPTDFQLWMVTFSDSIQYLCSLAQQSVENGIAIFKASNMLMNQMIPQSQFYEGKNVTINHFQQRLPLAFVQVLDPAYDHTRQCIDSHIFIKLGIFGR